jgi:hypothetical protein
VAERYRSSLSHAPLNCCSKGGAHDLPPQSGQATTCWEQSQALVDAAEAEELPRHKGPGSRRVL